MRRKDLILVCLVLCWMPWVWSLEAGRSLPGGFLSTSESCAPIEWTVRTASCYPVENCTFFQIQNFTQLNCAIYQKAVYYESKGKPGPVSLAYLPVGTYGHFQWSQETYIDTTYDPEIITMSRYIWSVDQQILYLDTMRYDLSTPAHGPPTQYFYSGTAQFSIFDEDSILYQSASVVRDTDDAPNPPQSSTHSTKYQRIRRQT